MNCIVCLANVTVRFNCKWIVIFCRVICVIYVCFVVFCLFSHSRDEMCI